MECDFLSTAIGDEPVPTMPSTTLRTDYDVVVFSLLLSYLPAPQQRLECCIRAHRVLKLHGLLLLITPDSSHQNKHVVMMKDWKRCIEAIGFHQWKYWKDKHLHCMAFRKTQATKQDYSDLGESCTLLYIPQDKHSQHRTTSEQNHSELVHSVHETFLSQLPFYDDNNP